MSTIGDYNHDYRDLFDGLVAGYDFKGDAKDFSGNGNDGTVSGATLTIDMFGIANSAYSFDGGDYIDCVGTASNLNFFITTAIFTFAFWFKSDDYTNNDLTFLFNAGSGSSGVKSFLIYVDNRSSPVLRVIANRGTSGSNAYYNNYNDLITDNNWNSIIVTSNGSSGGINLYYNGTLISPDATVWNGLTTGDLSNDLKIGDSFEGKIAQPKVWYRTLSAAEVKTLYDLTKSGYIYPYTQQREGGIQQ